MENWRKIPQNYHQILLLFLLNKSSLGVYSSDILSDFRLIYCINTKYWDTELLTLLVLKFEQVHFNIFMPSGPFYLQSLDQSTPICLVNFHWNHVSFKFLHFMYRVKTLIRCHILWHLIRIYTVCQMSLLCDPRFEEFRLNGEWTHKGHLPVMGR